MRVTLSGQAGLAVLHSHAQVVLYSMDDLDAPQRLARGTGIEHIFRGATDVLSTEVGDDATALSMLKTAWACDRLLQMLLILLRSDSDVEIREAAAEAAEELIGNDDARRFAINRLYSHPMTHDGDLDGAIQIAERVQASMTEERLRQLRLHQPAIAAITSEWQALLAALSDANSAARLRRILEQLNVFHRLAILDRRSQVDPPAGLLAGITVIG